MHPCARSSCTLGPAPAYLPACLQRHHPLIMLEVCLPRRAAFLVVCADTSTLICSPIVSRLSRCRYSFNDEHVSRLAPASVQTANAYILFYKKRE